jgi:hypothetical protein
MKTTASLTSFMAAFVLLILGQLHGTIVEAPNIAFLQEYLKENPTNNTLVILDLDDTLLVPTQTLGSYAWFCYRFKQLQKCGRTPEDAVEKTVAEWEAIRHITNMQTVETNTAEIVASLQKQGFTVMGLTTQGLALATRTIQQLQRVDIDLIKTAPLKEDYYFINNTPTNPNNLVQNGVIGNGVGFQGVLYRGGILFTAATNKATALERFIEHLGSENRPARIIFLNDNVGHLKDAEVGALRLGIPYVGLRYAYSDERVKNFNSEIAEIQFKHSTFQHILSDAEAAALR